MRSPHGRSNGMQALARAGCLVLCATASSSWGQIYVGGDRDAPGGVVLSNHPSPSAPTLLLPAELPPDGGSGSRALSAAAAAAQRPDARRQPTPAVAAVIGSMAREYDVAEALVKAVIAVESGFEPSARSRKGAMGLMQLMPETARRFGARDAYALEDNVRAGTAYLRWLLDYFAGDLELVLAAYNAGENAVVRAGRRIPDIAETRAYVPKVLSYLAHYSDGSALPR